MWHKLCRTFHPWCPCIKTRCLFYFCITTRSSKKACKGTNPCLGYILKDYQAGLSSLPFFFFGMGMRQKEAAKYSHWSDVWNGKKVSIILINNSQVNSLRPTNIPLWCQGITMLPCCLLDLREQTLKMKFESKYALLLRKCIWNTVWQSNQFTWWLIQY